MFPVKLDPLLVDVIYFVIGLFAVLAFSRIVYGFVKRVVKSMAKRTKTTLDDIIVEKLERPIYLGILIATTYLLLISLPSFSPYATAFHDAFMIIGVLWGIYFMKRLLDGFAEWGKKERMRTAEGTLILGGRNLLMLLVYIVGVFVILSYLGVDITPLIASLGIGGIAVALALQNTLADYFAGIYLSADPSIRVGDWVEVDNIVGQIEEIGWRSIKIRTWDENIVLIPNNVFTKKIVKNYFAPREELIFTVECGISYDSDLEKVERIVKNVAKKVQKRYGVEYEPLVRFTEFGDFSINFKVLMKAPQRGEMFPMKHDFIKTLKSTFEKEGIEIPYPYRNVIIKSSEGVKRSKR